MAPHSEKDTGRTTANGSYGTLNGRGTVNGGEQQSQFLSHLKSFPIVSDGISTYKTNRYGAKSISVIQNALVQVDQVVYKPIAPYLRTPFSFVAPYLAKADSLGDSSLSSLETRWPIVKEDTATLREKAQYFAGYPFKLVGDGKQNLTHIYQEEYAKYEKQGYNAIVGKTCALIDTDIRLVTALVKLGANFFYKAQDKTKNGIDRKVAVERKN